LEELCLSSEFQRLTEEKSKGMSRNRMLGKRRRSEKHTQTVEGAVYRKELRRNEIHSMSFQQN
jgi:hypothetical protein